MTLTKADIVAQVYAQGQLTKAEASEAVEKGLGLIKQALSGGEEVLVSGFGKWSVRDKAERRGRNPQTGDPLILPSRRVVTFRPSRVLKAKVQTEGPAEAAATGGGDKKTGGKVIRPGYF